jgi:hypothetical protein
MKQNKEIILLTDLDFMPKPWLDFYKETRRLMVEGLGYKLKRIITKPSPQGKGLHAWIYIEGPPLTEMELLKFQYIIGADCHTRSRINYRRVRRGLKGFWNKLFTVKHKIKQLPKRCQKCRIRKAVWELAEKDEIWKEAKTK